MLRTNLATRPFYNERAVHVVLAVVALVGVAMSVSGGTRLRALLSEHAMLTAGAEGDEQQAREVAGQSVRLQREIGSGEIEVLAAAAEEANRLIDQRVFSWTEFLNRIEATLPNDVMLTSLRPDVDTTGIGVAIGVIGRDVGAIDRFIERLEGTGGFTDVLSREEELTDAGDYRAVLFGRYVPRSASPTEVGASLVATEPTS